MNIAEANDAFSLQFALAYGHAVAWQLQCQMGDYSGCCMKKLTLQFAHPLD